MCSTSKPCQAYAGVASCAGGSIDGGTTSFVDGGDQGDVPIGACTPAPVDPCKTLPKLGWTQTLDGKGDDLCGVPSFQFTAQTAAKVNNYNNVPLSQFETVTARVAWTAAGISAFFDVLDSSVQTVNDKDPTQAQNKSYQGDSIEMFISSSNTVSGLTGTDNNTLHIIVPANGPAVQVKTSSSGSTPTLLPTGQFEQLKTATGYAIELQLPWPGSAPSSGTQVRFDLALNSADSNCSGVDDMRDGQMIYSLGTVSGSTTCQGSGDGTVPYCDDRTWCTTTLE